jgi:hypothetical protein
VILQIHLNENNSERTEDLARRVGRSPVELVNEAVERYLAETEPATSPDWKAAIMQAAGMWKDRDDLPDFDLIRQSMNRDVWSR